MQVKINMLAGCASLLILAGATGCQTPSTRANIGAASSTSSQSGAEQKANDVASAIAHAGGLELLPDPPHGYSTRDPLVFRKPNGEPVQARTVKTPCNFDPQVLNAHPAVMSLADLGLKNLQPTSLSLQDGRLDDPKVTILTGSRASLVQDSGVGIARLSNEEFFVITPCVRPYDNEGRKPFRKAELKREQVPDLADAEFLQADRIGSVRTGTELSTRYIGLWKQEGKWLIAEFTVPTVGAQSVPALPLMKSSLPVRSIDFFPSPDTPSGSVTLVQEAGRAIRVVKFNWWHG